jgi:hypothetical protein
MENKCITVIWDLVSAINLARDVEIIAEQNGLHIALAGGVLKKGYSFKDLDLLVYPHKAGGEFHVDYFIESFNRKGFSKWKRVDWTTPYGDNKIIFTTDYNGKRVDIFFLQLGDIQIKTS